MINLTKANLYRLSRQPGTWVLLALAVINTGLACFSVGVLFGNEPWLSEYRQNVVEMMEQNGIDLASALSNIAIRIDNSFDFTAFGMLAGTGLLLNPPVLMIFFITSFVLRDRTFGFSKNLIPAFSRNQLEAGQMLVIFIHSACAAAAGALPGLLLYRSFFTETAAGGNVFRFLLFLLIMALLIFDIGLFVHLLTGLFKRPLAGALLSLLYFTLGASLVYSLLTSVLSSIFRRTVPVQAFTPYGCLSTIIYSDDAALIRCGLTALLYGVLLILLRFYSVKNKALKDAI